MKINYFNWKKIDNRYLLTNDFGNFCYISKDSFIRLINKQEIIDAYEKECLIEKGFIFMNSTEEFIQSFVPYLHSMKSYVFQGPTLHIFVVTTACNGDCIYCQAKSNATSKRLNMTFETAEKAVNLALQSPSETISFEFQGGEPLMNFECIRHIIEYTEEININKQINFNLVSNLTLMTDEMLQFFIEHNVQISTSLDGPKDVHNSNRPYSNGNGMYSDCIKQMNKLKMANLSFGAIQTTTRKSLFYAEEIVKEYQSQGLHSIFLRPLTMLGMAFANKETISYSADEFTEFYRTCMEIIIQLNKNGYYMSEGHAVIFLKRILHQYSENYMDLRSPCGGGIGQIAYYPDGSVFTCDEGRMLAEMGNPAFRMGNINNSYTTLLQSAACGVVCKESISEAQTTCSQCVYQPYCGICPVLRYANNLNPGEISPNDYRCSIYRGILDVLFELLRDSDNEKLLRTWIE